MPLCDASLECEELETASSTASPQRRLRSLVDVSAAPADGRVADAARRFGEALRDYRRAAALTQEELAERAGVSPRSISGLERGEGSTPRRDTVALLAKALQLTELERAAFEQLLVRGRGLRPRLLLRASSPSPDRLGDQRLHNLPLSLDSFVGRELDMSMLGPVLARAPLTTLLGAGGTGKTRLARELAHRHLAAYADGAWLVELAEINDPALVPGAVAAAVGLRDFHARNTTEILSTYLRPKQVLIVLDNCEHLIDACAVLLAGLLRDCPNLHVLATSREPLGINGEIVWLVRPLELPDVGSPCADTINCSPAARLFVERARAVVANFVPTDDNAPAIARICMAVDGLPLALELAAARTRLLTLQQLADRLEQDVYILRGFKRDSSPRHETIRATIDWSHELLGEREQILLRRLAVFAGGWTLDMAEDICSGPGIDLSDVLDVLAQLVDKSMVQATARETVARYRLLSPIRQYALERLQLAGEEAEYAARHSATLLRLPQSGGVDDFGPDEIASLDRFEVEHANLRVALRWGLNHGDNEAVLRAASALFRFWERRGHFQEGCAWLEEALGNAGTTPSRYRGPALNALAFLYWRVGDIERAHPIAEQALAVNRASGRPLAVAFALGNLGAIAYLRDQPQVSVGWLEESVAVARETGYAPMTSVALTLLARSHLRLGGPSDGRASALLDESLSLAEAAHARYAMGHALLTLGDLHWLRGEADRAIPFWHRALVVGSQLSDPRGIAGPIERLAWGMTRNGQFESAAWLFGAADARYRMLGVELRHDEELDHEDLVFQTRQNLGRAFDKAWSDGQASTVEEAVDLALQLANPSVKWSAPYSI